jgi:amino acid adenylation domain-containing protein
MTQVPSARHFVPFRKENIEQSIPARFEQQVQLHPNRLAVKTGRQALSYAELQQAADRVATAVLEAAGEDEAPVALLFEQGVQLIYAILAVLKAGKIYVPLDPLDSRQRLNFMLQDSGAALILSDGRNYELAGALGTGRRPVINAERIRTQPRGGLFPEVAPQRLAYIFYTSGSTGEPKGVFDCHRNILHNIMRYTNNLGISSADRMTLLQSCSFSGSVSSLFCALLNGAAVYPIDLRKQGIDGLAQWIIQEQITIYHSVPTVFQQLMACGQPFPSLRLIRLEGDQTAVRHVRLYQERFDHRCVLVNGLGATETGITRQYFIRPDTELSGEMVPIGCATEDMEACLIDESGDEVPQGEVGEITIRSRYLACGYWRNPSLTHTAFRPCPKDKDHRIFRTGDLGRMRPDGCLEYLGRRDFQVKISGQWVMIPRIEAALSGIEGIREAVVASRDQGHGRRLTGYVVPSGTGPTVSAIQQALAEKLPRYMIPSAYVMLDALPLDVNGKVDRRSLPSPANVRPLLETPYVTARNEIEQKVAAIWSQVLNLPEIGMHDNFFELGGDSVQAMMIMNRVRATFRIHLSPVVLFEAPTVAKMARVLAAKKTLEAGIDG